MGALNGVELMPGMRVQVLRMGRILRVLGRDTATVVRAAERRPFWVVVLDDAVLYDDGAYPPKLVKQVCLTDYQVFALPSGDRG